MKFARRIYEERYPESYPLKLDSEFRRWAMEQKFPIFRQAILTANLKDDGVVHTITAMPMYLWKERDHKIKKGERALFWLGNWPWWTNRQVEHIDGFAFWDDERRGEIEYCNMDASVYDDEGQYAAGEAAGGPFF